MVNAHTCICSYSFIEGSSLNFFCVSWKGSSTGTKLRKQREKHSLVLHGEKFQKAKSQSFYHGPSWPLRSMKWHLLLPVLKYQACKWAAGTQSLVWCARLQVPVLSFAINPYASDDHFLVCLDVAGPMTLPHNPQVLSSCHSVLPLIVIQSQCHWAASLCKFWVLHAASINKQARI